MKKRMMTALFFVCCLATGFPVYGQFTPEEVAERAQWEEFLTTAEIVKSEQIGIGVTKPWRLYLKKGDIEKTAAWKHVDENLGDGATDRWQHEIAAYRLDKLIGLNMIPIYVEREFRGKKGALSLWANYKHRLDEVVDKGIKVPDSARQQYYDMAYIYYLWDSLIANDDPTQENILYTEDWRSIFIDHSRAFRSNREYTKRLVFGTNGIKKRDNGKPYLMRRVPRVLLEKMNALDLDSIKQAVGSYLTDKEIESIIARKQLIKDEIAAMIKQYGEDKVLY